MVYSLPGPIGRRGSLSGRAGWVWLEMRRATNMHRSRVLPGLAGLAVAAAMAGNGLPPELAEYNVVWTSPSSDHRGSMPLGNGDIGLNAWVEPDGDLCFYIGKTDAWEDNARLAKVGKVRVRFDPALPATGGGFRQELDLATATLRVRTGAESAIPNPQSEIDLWVDAHRPVIHVESRHAEPVTATVSFELWRTNQYTLPSIECSDVMLNRAKPNQMEGPTVVEPDTVLSGLADRIGWCHRNVKSVGPDLTMKLQGLDGLLREDPLRHRTFGAVITAGGGRAVDERTLAAAPARSHRICVHVLTKHPATGEEWTRDANRLVASASEEPPERSRAAHEAWWREFWSRSWIFVEGPRTPPPPVLPPNRLPLKIGEDQQGANRFAGDLGRVSFFRRSLGGEEIAALAGGNREALTARPGLSGSWTSVAPGTRLESVEEQLGGALTIEAWIRPGALPPAGGRIVDRVTPGGADGFLIDTYPGRSLRFICGKDQFTLKDAFMRDRWHHVALAVEPSTGLRRLYLDGKMVDESRADPLSDAAVVTRGYVLQRFITACAGRGDFPIKFNGSIFTVPFAQGPGGADYRRWGPGYWWQNTRLPYIGLCTSGDFDLQQPLFRMYAGPAFEVGRERVRRYFGHGGIYYPECIYFWGAVFSETYGWKPAAERTDKLQESGWHKWEWVSGPEFVWMMLDYYDHTLDGDFLGRTILPVAREVLLFFDKYYPTGEDGKLVMHPSQAVETWWDCTNPMPELAGLHAVTQRLLALPEGLTRVADREAWRAFAAKLPPLPTRDIGGVRMLAPAARFADKRNIENPELYAVFPFRRVSFEKENARLGVEALSHAWDRGHQGWRQDDIFMAYLGLAEDARTNLVSRARQSDSNSRFPAFWGPNYDWVPDQDHGGVLMKALQAMILQSEGERIFLLPAWPRGWDVSFKLHAPRRTVVEGEVRGGRLTRLEVTPPERKVDVIRPAASE